MRSSDFCSRTKGCSCVPCTSCVFRIAINECICPGRLTSGKLTQPHGLSVSTTRVPSGAAKCTVSDLLPEMPLRVFSAGLLDADRIRYLVDPASSHMLVSKTKPCKSKYKHLIRRNCRWLIKTVIVYLMVSYYLDNRSNSRANTCTKAQLTTSCIY